MENAIFEVGKRVRINSYGPFRGLRGTICKVDAITDLSEPHCFYLIDLEGAQVRESGWFEQGDVDAVSLHESDWLARFGSFQQDQNYSPQ